jgi:hypothetical protein
LNQLDKHSLRRGNTTCSTEVNTLHKSPLLE